MRYVSTVFVLLALWGGLTCAAEVPFGAYLDFNTGEGKLLKLSAVGDGSREPAEIDGARCVKTDPAGHRYYLYFDVDDYYIYGGQQDVLVTVEYYDNGASGFSLSYDGKNGSWTGGGSAPREDSRKWRTYTFRLKDARFTNRSNSNDFRLNNSRGEPLYVRFVGLSMATMDLSAKAPFLSADGESKTEINVFLKDHWGLPRKEGKVTLSATSGRIASPVEIKNGVGTAAYVSGKEPGTVKIEASAGALSGNATLTLLPTKGNLLLQKAVVDEFEPGEDTWKAFNHNGGGAASALSKVADPAYSGSGALKIVYRGTRDYVYLECFAPALRLPGAPKKLSVWARGSGGDTLELFVRLRDQTGQLFQFPLGEIKGSGWTQLSGDVSSPQSANSHWAGAADGIIHYPFTLYALVVQGGMTETEIFLDRLEVESYVGVAD